MLCPLDNKQLFKYVLDTNPKSLVWVCLEDKEDFEFIMKEKDIPIILLNENTEEILNLMYGNAIEQAYIEITKALRYENEQLKQRMEEFQQQMRKIGKRTFYG